MIGPSNEKETFTLTLIGINTRFSTFITAEEFPEDYIVFGVGGRFRFRRGGRRRVMDDSSGSGRPPHVHKLARSYNTTGGYRCLSNGNGLDASNFVLIILLNFGTVDPFWIPMKVIFILNR